MVLVMMMIMLTLLMIDGDGGDIVDDYDLDGNDGD